MSIVGAYIELRPGVEIPDPGTSERTSGEFISKTSEGLEVRWHDENVPPDEAQVYLGWAPVVWAYWNDEEIEDGEDREDADGSDVEQRDEEVPTESDLGTGEGGEGDGDVQSTGTLGGGEEVE